MSHTFTLVSSHEISREDFLNLLQQSGVVLQPDEVYDGRISQEDRHVWLALNTTCLRDYEDEQEARDRLVQLLGGELKSCIDLNVSRTHGSQQLAVEFACLCATKYPCAVDDNMGKIFTAQELFALRHTGNGFGERKYERILL